MTAKDIIKILEAHGFKLVRIEGSHHIYGKQGYPRSISVPVHGKKEISYFSTILRQAGIDPKDIR
jgi:predicted RNA binding protein YcfA (HicA-like mRNA interferase family)